MLLNVAMGSLLTKFIGEGHLMCLSSYKDPCALLAGVAACMNAHNYLLMGKGINRNVKYAPRCFCSNGYLPASCPQPCSNCCAV